MLQIQDMYIGYCARQLCDFRHLKALLASTRRMASVPSSSNFFLIACIEASIPPLSPAHVCKGAVACVSSGFSNVVVALPMILLTTSPIPIGQTPGFLSKGISRHAVKALRK